MYDTKNARCMDRNKRSTIANFEINLHPDIVSVTALILFAYLLIYILMKIGRVKEKMEVLVLFLLTSFAGYLLVFFSREIMLGAIIPFGLLWIMTFLKVKFAEP